MAIFFRNTPVREPFTYDSVGNRWQQEPTVRPGGYPLYHYLQTESGCGQISIQGRTFTQEEDEGVLIAPFVRHSYAAKEGTWHTLFATFTGTIESDIAKMLKNQQTIFIKKEQGGQIASLISDAVTQYEHPPIDEEALSINCYRLLMCFIDGVYTNEQLQNPLYQQYLAPVMQEIETNYSTGLTVQELSSLVYITPQYLSRLFRRFLGCSAYEYLTNYRISKAKEFLITRPETPVQVIAQQVGFVDASHFTAMFKKITGMTPLEFRKLN